jgi:hypothetical protein
MLNINTQAQAKKTARALEKALERNGISLQHGKALDVLASLCGRQDWNSLTQALSPEGVDSVLNDFEREHVADSAGDAYGNECMLVAHTGFQLRYSAEDACDYVRVCDPLGREIVYWCSDEWAEDPQVVMGAMLGALVRGKPVEVSGNTAAAPSPATVDSKKAKQPTIQDVCFTDVSSVCINRGSGFRMNYVEDQVVGLLLELDSEEFAEKQEDDAIFMERDDDGRLDYRQITLGQLARLKWDAKEKLFVAPDGTTYEFYFPVNMQSWFDMATKQAPAVSAPPADSTAEASASGTSKLHLYQATFGSDAAPVMQMSTLIAAYSEAHATARLRELFQNVPTSLNSVSVQLAPADAVTRFSVFVDGGYYDAVRTLQEAVCLADALEPTATDEVSVEDDDGNSLWTIKALGDKEDLEPKA